MSDEQHIGRIEFGPQLTPQEQGRIVQDALAKTTREHGELQARHQDERKRGDTYRNRALVLLKLLRHEREANDWEDKTFVLATEHRAALADAEARQAAAAERQQTAEAESARLRATLEQAHTFLSVRLTGEHPLMLVVAAALAASPGPAAGEVAK